MAPAAVLLLAVLAAGIGYGLSQTGGGDESSTVVSNESGIANDEEPTGFIDEPEESPEIPVESVNPDPPAGPQGVLSLTPVSTISFEGQVPDGWNWKTKDKTVSSIRTMNVWEDPADPLIDIQVDNQAAAGVSPLDSALSVRDENSSSIDGYSEVDIGPMSLAGRPAARWTFDALEDGQTIRKIDIFFTSCDTDFAVVGAAPKADFAAYRKTFRAVAASIDGC